MSARAQRRGKAFERLVAKQVGGRRYWANSGGFVDVETPTWVIQTKRVQACSLAQLVQLAVRIEQEGRRVGKDGCVMIALPRSRTIVVAMTCQTWCRRMNGGEHGQINRTGYHFGHAGPSEVGEATPASSPVDGH